MKRFGKDATKSKQQRSTHGEQLAKALNWIITDDMFADVVLHGNIDWIVVHLVRVAILWVWSSQRELVVSANDAIEKTAELFGTSGINSYQTLINAWKIGPSYSSERAHFLAMLETMKSPEKTLFCGDAGFVGYDFWNAIHEANHRFLCRVGSNCRFINVSSDH